MNPRPLSSSASPIISPLNVTLVKDMKLTGQLAGHQLTHFHDALYKSQRSIITGSRSFTNVTMTKDLTSTGSVNGLDLAANLVYLDQDTTLDGSYQLSEASIKNIDVAGTVDGVDWDTILDKISRVGEEQTIPSKYSFSSPTSSAPLNVCESLLQTLMCSSPPHCWSASPAHGVEHSAEVAMCLQMM